MAAARRFAATIAFFCACVGALTAGLPAFAETLAGAPKLVAPSGDARVPAGPLLAPRAFTDAFVVQLKQVMPGRTIEIKAPLEVRYKLADGSWTSAFLDNAYRTYRERPADGQAILHHFAGVYARLARDVDMPVDVRRIVPVIKDRRWLDGVLKTMRAGGAKGKGEQATRTPLHDALNETLVVLYAEDMPSHLRYLTDETFAKTRLERDKLRAVAVANLKRVLPRVQFRHRPDGGFIEAGSMHEASLLLVADIWTELKGKVDGDPVVAVPARGKLLFTGSRDREGIAALRKKAAELARSSSYALTEQLFVIRSGKVDVYR